MLHDCTMSEGIELGKTGGGWMRQSLVLAVSMAERNCSSGGGGSGSRKIIYPQRQETTRL